MINLQLPNVDGKEPNRRSVVVMDSENVTLGKRQTDIGYCRMGIIDLDGDIVRKQRIGELLESLVWGMKGKRLVHASESFESFGSCIVIIVQLEAREVSKKV